MIQCNKCGKSLSLTEQQCNTAKGTKLSLGCDCGYVNKIQSDGEGGLSERIEKGAAS